MEDHEYPSSQRGTLNLCNVIIWIMRYVDNLGAAD